MARSSAALADLGAVATECQARAASLSDEQADEGMTITDGLRAVFQRPASTSSAVAKPAAPSLELLSVVPPELLSIILSQLRIRALARLAATCRSLWCGVPNPPSPLPKPGLVETELRRRADARGLHIGSSLPEELLSWVPYLLKRDFHDALRREAPLAMGRWHSLFVDREGRLHLACCRERIQAGKVGEPLLGHEGVSGTGAFVSIPPTLLPSMQDKRIVSVASSDRHCLALSAEGEVYSWGDGTHGALGHADWSSRAGPSRIETLAGVESVSAGSYDESAAVDNHGRLFTWGRAKWPGYPTGLGYVLDPETESQLTPKRVDALSEERVVSVALGWGFSLAVTDAGAVFSFGHSGALGHDSRGSGDNPSQVLPRRIEALAETGQRFVAVAAGFCNALVLTEEGQVYGWGPKDANGRGQNLSTPQRVAALASQRVKLVYAQAFSLCAVTEKGELYTWGGGGVNLGHGVAAPQLTPKRVEALSGVKVASVAICDDHTLVAGEDGLVFRLTRSTPAASAMQAV